MATSLAAVRQLGHVRWAWAAAAAGAAVTSVVLFAGVRLVLLRAAGGRMGAGTMIGLTFASGAIAASVPAGGAVATAYTFREYRHAGADDGGATWALFVNGVVTPGVLAVLGLVGIAVGVTQRDVGRARTGRRGGGVRGAGGLRAAATDGPRPADRPRPPRGAPAAAPADERRVGGRGGDRRPASQPFGSAPAR